MKRILFILILLLSMPINAFRINNNINLFGYGPNIIKKNIFYGIQEIKEKGRAHPYIIAFSGFALLTLILTKKFYTLKINLKLDNNEPNIIIDL